MKIQSQPNIIRIYLSSVHMCAWHLVWRCEFEWHVTYSRDKNTFENKCILSGDVRPQCSGSISAGKCSATAGISEMKSGLIATLKDSEPELRDHDSCASIVAQLVGSVQMEKVYKDGKSVCSTKEKMW